MIKALSASVVYPVSSVPLLNGVIILDNSGVVLSVLSKEQAEYQGIDGVEFFEGALIPGLVNTHCHLELSHLFNVIPPHTGLHHFVEKVIQSRGATQEVVLEAMKQADQQMLRNGIVAVGDISNSIVSKAVKLSSELYYHTFVEILGFDPEKASDIMKRGEELKSAFEPLSASINPHAPYSVSKELFAEIRRYSSSTANLISIHNQETADENLFFEKKQGAFLKLYALLGLNIDFFKASGKTSLQTVLPELPSGKTLLVHNTLTTAADVEIAKAAHQKLYWCLCPNANLYIENRLAAVKMLQDAGVKLTLGTDSLASNHQLSILAEMCTLQQNIKLAKDPAAQQHPYLSFEDLLRWGTLNGAEFLGISEQYGSFEPGKKPGVNLIQGMVGQQLSSTVTIERLI